MWGQTIATVLFVMWDEFFRRAIHAMVVLFASDELRSRVDIFFGAGRELSWWWPIAGLSAIVISYLRRMISVKGSLAELRIAHAGSADSTQIDAEAPNSGVAEQTGPPALRVTRLRVRRFRAKPDKKIVDGQAAGPSSWKTPFMATCMVW